MVKKEWKNMKSYTDLEQSKKLAEILSLESADMFLALNGTIPVMSKYIDNGLVTADDTAIPCWSLAALLDVIPEGLIETYYIPNIQKENGKYSIAYGDEELLCEADNPIDACFKLIIKLHEQKLL